MKNILFILLGFLFTSTGLAQIPEAASIDSIFAEWDKPDTPGCSLGIIRDGRLIYARGYGMANLEYDIPNSSTSVFRIGSTSKQFTAACIVLLAEKGELSLDDKLSKFFPDFPTYAETITIRHLLNHTSGIRDYLMLAVVKGLRDDDYYKDEDIMGWLINQEELNFTPGEEFLYSNSGYWLLGQIVNKVSGKNMADFAKEEIFNPLGMTYTHFHNDHKTIVKNRASGYYPIREGGFEISMTTLDMIGDGGIFTSIEDIKKWDDAYYETSVLSKEFWDMMQQQGVLNDGEVLKYASGLNISTYKGLKTVSHGGAFVGFRADIIRFPEQKFSVAIFTNRGDANPTRIGYEVADIFLKDKYVTESKIENIKKKEPLPALSDPEFSYDKMTGTYELQPGADLIVSVKNDSINVVQSWNKSSYNIERISGNTFQIGDDPSLSFTFSDLEEGSTSLITVIQNGSKTLCKRKQEVDNSKTNMSDYEGEYYSKELDVAYQIILKDEKLQLLVKNNEPLIMEITNNDQLVVQGMRLRFIRNLEKVVGFQLDAGRVKNLNFSKK